MRPGYPSQWLSLGEIPLRSSVLRIPVGPAGPLIRVTIWPSGKSVVERCSRLFNPKACICIATRMSIFACFIEAAISRSRGPGTAVMALFGNSS